MKIEGDKITFTSGREKYANKGIIGLSPEGNVSEGYDGGLWHPDSHRPITPTDRIELGTYMMSRWTEFTLKAIKEALSGKSKVTQKAE